MKSAAFALSFLLLSLISNAATVTWTGGTGNWSVPGNWDTGTVPTTNDIVIISSTSEVTIPSAYAAAAMTVDNNGILNVSANASLSIGSNTGSYSGLDNNGTVNNWGTINIDDITTISVLFTYGHGIFAGGTINNESTGIINISNIERDGIFMSGISTFNNDGTINILSGIGDDGISSYANSGGNLTNTGTINITDAVSDAISLENPSRIFTNTGDINVSDAGQAAFNVLGILNNEAGGTITVHQAGLHGFWVRTNGVFTNEGSVTLKNGITSSGISCSATTTNSACGLIDTEVAISVPSPGNFTNNGWVISTYNGSGPTTAFVNNGVIQDRFDAFLGVANNKVIAVEKSGTYCSGHAVADFFDLGSLSGFSITNNAFYLENSLTTSAGSFDPMNNTFTPNANAVGSKVFYAEFNDDANACSQIILVGFSDNILSPTIFYEDSDSDGAGNPASSTTDCSTTPPTGYVANSLDCDDTDPLEFPNQTWYADLDNDGYTDGTSLMQCERPVGYKVIAELSGTGDCDDNDPNRFPGNPEICDGKDNDCDGDIDEGTCTGNTCALPFIISSLPFTHSGTTQGAGDDYDDTDACGSDWMNGEDVVFAFNATAGSVARIKLELTNSPNANSAPAVFVLDGCPDSGANCLYEAEATNGTTTIYIETVHIQTSGTYYIVVSSHATFHNWFDFTLTIDIPTGNVCENARDISALPYSYSGTTELLGDDYDNGDACGSQWMSGNDMVFKYDSPGGEVARFQLDLTNSPGGGAAPAIFVLDGCPDSGANCLYEVEGNSGTTTVYLETVHFQTAGTYYIVVASYQTFHQWFEFDLTIDLPTGNICENGRNISALPYSFSGTTELYGDDYDNGDACGSQWMSGNEVVFRYNSPGNEVARFQLDVTHTPNVNSAPALFVLDGCPDSGANCLYEVEGNNGTTTVYLETVHFQTAGTYYIVVASYQTFHQWFEFDLTIDLPTGNICENAVPIPALPFSSTGESTCLFGDDYDSSGDCSTIHMNGNDKVYKFTPGTSGSIDIQLTNLSDDWTAINFSDDCPNSGTAICTTLVNNTTSDYMFENLSVTAGTDYYITISSHPTFTDCFNFDIAVAEAGALPVELALFAAQKMDEETVELKWETATEIDLSHFEIERSENGTDWENIAHSPALGHASEPHFYTVIDHLGHQMKASPKNHFFYRLRMVDVDGSFEFSPVRSILFEQKGSGIQIFPNPSSGQFQIHLPNGMEESVELELFSGNGQVLLRKNVSPTDEKTIRLGMDEPLPEGIHLLLIRQNGQVIGQEKLVVFR